MLGALADGGPKVPAPLAFGCRERSAVATNPAGCRVGLQRSRPPDVAERGQQFAIRHPAAKIVVRPWCRDYRLLGAADRLALPQALRARSRFARGVRAALPAGIAIIVPRGSAREIPPGERLRACRRGRPIIPRFIGGVRDDRGQQAGQVIVQPRQDKLGGPAVGARGGLGIEPVLQARRGRSSRARRHRTDRSAGRPGKTRTSRKRPGRRGSPC